jgi:hypothetical protein
VMRDLNRHKAWWRPVWLMPDGTQQHKGWYGTRRQAMSAVPDGAITWVILTCEASTIPAAEAKTPRIRIYPPDATAMMMVEALQGLTPNARRKV